MPAVYFKPSARKALEKLPRQDQVRIAEKIDRLAAGDHVDLKKLADPPNSYRLRVGDYRILFTLIRGDATIYRIAHRKEAYR